MPILPMSCSSAPRRSTSISLSETCICRPIATEIALTRSEWPAVYGIPRVERGGQRADGADDGGVRLGPGRRQRLRQAVEGGDERGDLAARRPRRRQPRRHLEVGHLRHLARQPIDRRADRPCQAEARQQAQPEAGDDDPDQLRQRRLGQAAHLLRHRIDRVERRRPDLPNLPVGEHLAVDLEQARARAGPSPTAARKAGSRGVSALSKTRPSMTMATPEWARCARRSRWRWSSAVPTTRWPMRPPRTRIGAAVTANG